MTSTETDCGQSLISYVKAAWPIIEPGVPLLWNWHIEAVCIHLEAITFGKIQKLIINIPPRSSKSNIVSVLWPTWEWIFHPSMKWVFASYNLQKVSLPLSVKRREVILSDWYQERWGDRVTLARDQREKSHFKNTKRGQMFVTATGGTVTGMGGNRLVLDDPQDPMGAESEIARGSTNAWLNSVWPSRKDSPAAAEVLIQQRLHEIDATGLFLLQGDWDHLKIPMEYDPDAAKKTKPTSLGFKDPRTEKGQVLDSRRWPEKFLTDLKKRLGPYGTAGQLQQEPAPHGGAIIKEQWIGKWVEKEVDGKKLMDVGDYMVNPWKCMRMVVVDLATTEKTTTNKNEPDYTVIGAFTLFMTGRGPYLFLNDLIRDRFEGPDIEKSIDAFCKHWRPAIVAVETVAFQSNMGQRLKRAPYGLPVRELSTKEDAIYKIDGDKVARAYNATPLMADRRFFVPMYAPWLEELIRELTRFPNAQHDDQVDVVTYACAIAMKYGVNGRLPTISDKPQMDTTRTADAQAVNNPAARDQPPHPWEGLRLTDPRM